LLKEIALLRSKHNWEGKVMLSSAAEFVSLR